MMQRVCDLNGDLSDVYESLMRFKISPIYSDLEQASIITPEVLQESSVITQPDLFLKLLRIALSSIQEASDRIHSSCILTPQFKKFELDRLKYITNDVQEFISILNSTDTRHPNTNLFRDIHYRLKSSDKVLRFNISFNFIKHILDTLVDLVYSLMTWVKFDLDTNTDIDTDTIDNSPNNTKIERGRRALSHFITTQRIYTDSAYNLHSLKDMFYHIASHFGEYGEMYIEDPDIVTNELLYMMCLRDYTFTDIVYMELIRSMYFAKSYKIISDYNIVSAETIRNEDDIENFILYRTREEITRNEPNYNE